MKKLFFLFIILINGCSKKPNYYELGVSNYEKGNYALAKSQLLSVKKNNPNFILSKKYLKKLDSVETILLIKVDSISKIKKEVDSNVEKFSGTYKIEVDGISSAKMAEIYILENNGTASWLWVYFKGKRKIIDERKIGKWSATTNSVKIDISGQSEMITEVYSLKNGVLRENKITKRWLKKTNEQF